MHGLDTIRRLNARATQKCEGCQSPRIELEARKDFLGEYFLDNACEANPRLLCRVCLKGLMIDGYSFERVDTYRAARRENETEV
jgi:hypothetical protein